MINPYEIQIGGTHYKQERTIQPLQVFNHSSLSFSQASAIKYLLRYKKKGGLQDLQKAMHIMACALFDGQQGIPPDSYEVFWLTQIFGQMTDSTVVLSIIEDVILGRWRFAYNDTKVLRNECYEGQQEEFCKELDEYMADVF